MIFPTSLSVGYVSIPWRVSLRILLLHFGPSSTSQGSVLERSLAGNLWQLQDVRTTLAEGFDVDGCDGWVDGADGGWCGWQLGYRWLVEVSEGGLTNPPFITRPTGY